MRYILLFTLYLVCTFPCLVSADWFEDAERDTEIREIQYRLDDQEYQIERERRREQLEQLLDEGSPLIWP